MNEKLQQKIEKIRYILFDLDGTLFGANHCLDAEAAEMLRELMRRGYYVGAATGRSLISLFPYFDIHGFCFNAPCVGSAGAEAGTPKLCDAERVYCRTFPDDSLREILRDFTARGYSFCTDGAKQIYISEREQQSYVQYEREEARKMGYSYPEIVPVPDADTDSVCNGSVFKLMVFYKTEQQEEFIFSYLSSRDDVHGFLPGGFHMVEMLPTGVDKALGVQKAAESLGLTLENCCVFGDSGNDVAMLKAAGLSVAMCNASDDAKQAADLITDLPNSEQGAVRMALKLFPALGETR
ncbi:MAG: HAD family hydrolase [Oscillospiraceae bacterium]|nr:HAD family hydrolase [Oscillospiraceae bacterium]